MPRNRSWGYDEETKKKVDALQKEADEFTRTNQDELAIAKWQEIAHLQPMNPLPNRRLAGLYLRLNKPSEALPFLVATLPLELQDDRYAKRVARTYDSAGDSANAMRSVGFLFLNSLSFISCMDGLWVCEGKKKCGSMRKRRARPKHHGGAARGRKNRLLSSRPAKSKPAFVRSESRFRTA